MFKGLADGGIIATICVRDEGAGVGGAPLATMCRVKARRAANQPGAHGGAVADSPVSNEPGSVETIFQFIEQLPSESR